MDSIGFTPFDISEIHSAGDMTIQIDIIFIRKISFLSNHVQSIISS
jgi:hypothetical protein